MQCIAVCCSVMQYAALCRSMLQCVAACCSVLQYAAVCCNVLQCVAGYCSVLQCVAVCCSLYDVRPILVTHMNEVYFTNVCSHFAVERRLYTCSPDLCHITLLLYILVYFTIVLTTLQVHEACPTEIQPKNIICDPDLSHMILLLHFTAVLH